MDILVTFLILAPAVLLYAQRSTWLIDYLVWVTVLNRGIRRYVDWMSGAFNPLSPISLTPLAISGLLFLLCFSDFQKFPAAVKRIFQFLGVALVLGFAVGLVRNQFAAVYALAEYVAPISIMGCAVIFGRHEEVLDRWIKSVGWAAVAASAYGWYQYYTIPAWDAFWVRSVGFEGYLGQLKPTEMTVFSTMGERGVLAGFLASAVIPMIVSSRWRNITGWFSVILILSVILLTFVRTSLITIMLATVMFPVLNRGKNTMQIILLLCVVAVAGNFGLSHLAGSEKISSRLETLQSVSEDGSFKGRVNIANYGLGVIASNPLGSGLGSSGLGGRVNGDSGEGAPTIGDNGYFSLMFSFGWVGSFCFFYAFYLMWQRVSKFGKLGVTSEPMMMFKALMVTGSVTLMVADWIAAPSAIVFFIFAGWAIHPQNELLKLLLKLRLRNLEGELAGELPEADISPCA